MTASITVTMTKAIRDDEKEIERLKDRVIETREAIKTIEKVTARFEKVTNGKTTRSANPVGGEVSDGSSDGSSEGNMEDDLLHNVSDADLVGMVETTLEDLGAGSAMKAVGICKKLADGHSSVITVGRIKTAIDSLGDRILRKRGGAVELIVGSDTPDPDLSNRIDSAAGESSSTEPENPEGSSEPSESDQGQSNDGNDPDEGYI